MYLQLSSSLNQIPIWLYKCVRQLSSMNFRGFTSLIKKKRSDKARESLLGCAHESKIRLPSCILSAATPTAGWRCGKQCLWFVKLFKQPAGVVQVGYQSAGGLRCVHVCVSPQCLSDLVLHLIGCSLRIEGGVCAM